MGLDWPLKSFWHWEQYLSVLFKRWWFLDISNTLLLKSEMSNCLVPASWRNLSASTFSVNHTAAVVLSGILAAPCTWTSLVVCRKWTQTDPIGDVPGSAMRLKDILVRSGTPALSTLFRTSLHLTCIGGYWLTDPSLIADRQGLTTTRYMPGLHCMLTLVSLLFTTIFISFLVASLQIRAACLS